ncbi:hypothetical protein SAMN03159448_00195 [Sinorhizobium sp. NFACC03]|nr:hypothetical protein SAMN03159448_00195 [Sinorhizobium sp. NFACC03]
MSSLGAELAKAIIRFWSEAVIGALLIIRNCNRRSITPCCEPPPINFVCECSGGHTPDYAPANFRDNFRCGHTIEARDLGPFIITHTL